MVYGRLPYTGSMVATKNDRLDLRLTAEQKHEIEQAAALSGRSVTDFSVAVLVREADAVIQQDRELRVSQRGWEAFNESINRPADTVDGLARLLTRPSVFVD